MQRTAVSPSALMMLQRVLAQARRGWLAARRPGAAAGSRAAGGGCIGRAVRRGARQRQRAALLRQRLLLGPAEGLRGRGAQGAGPRAGAGHRRGGLCGRQEDGCPPSSPTTPPQLLTTDGLCDRFLRAPACFSAVFASDAWTCLNALAIQASLRAAGVQGGMGRCATTTVRQTACTSAWVRIDALPSCNLLCP